MKRVLIKRSVSFLAAICMMIWMAAAVVPAMPVMAIGNLSAEATASTGSVESGDSPVIRITFTQSNWEGAIPDNVWVTSTGDGGLTGKDSSRPGTSISLDDTTSTLTFAIMIPARTFKYDGVGNAGLILDVTYSCSGVTTDNSTLATLAVTKDPEKPQTPDDGDDEEPAPPVIAGTIFTIDEGAELPSIDAGESKIISYPITSGIRRISGDVQITAKLPEKLYFNTASATQTFAFTRDRTNYLDLDVSADAEITTGTYPITLTITYKYGGEAKTETLETYVKVNGKEPEKAGAGQLTLAGYKVNPGSVNAGQKFKADLTIQNTGAKNYENILVTLGGLSTEAFTMDGTVDSQRIASLKAGESKTLTFALASSEKMATGNYSLDVTMACGEESYTAKAFVSVTGDPTKQEDDGEKPKTEGTPQLIIESYNYGEGVTAVTGGEVFTLTAAIRNTGKAPVRNVKITVSAAADEETGGAFSPANSSNTFYIDSIAAGGSVTKSIDLLPKADAKPKSYGVEFAFSYEAIVNDELVTKEVTQTLAIPLTQPDRFEVTEPQMYGPVMQGETLSGSVSYVNKGKSTIFNLSVKVEGEGFTTAETEAYIGNVESGASDSYDLAINPTQAGTVSGTITFTYEDSNGDTKELVKEFTSEVMEYVEPDIPDIVDPNMPVEAEGGMPVWGWIAIAAGGVVALVAVIVVIRKVVKKKKQAALDAEDDYDDEDTGEQP
ncbi:MAG TPA: hypothetical protein IAB51_11835 [Candidatus Merdivicinus excrementipullorum]|uniref:CARDB domain-containing protein n=1 Tax=Candidatus Merdivicinus excrementipullorum TaxID=2840867 RepID=A0A9D1FPI2_9FIRM|nr:hypothetical protein [Candidatus Merdivicinus excrementipullorum]